jgi:hypothetical protein
MNDFYYDEENGKIRSLCACRLYKMLFREKKYDVVQMMDFVTADEYRKKGEITRISNYIYEKSECDFFLGFASQQIYKSVYKSKQQLGCFFRYEIDSLNLKCCKDFEVIDDLGVVAIQFNKNQQALQVEKNVEYLRYLMRCPDYDSVFFVKRDDLFVQYGIRNGCVRILDISDYSVKSIYKALRIAANFGEKVIVEFPYKSKSKKMKLVSSSVVVVNYKKVDILSAGRIWIPVLDRK